jgi:DNA-directed RNA polymerase I, II, and III subunit RPABC1
MESITNSGIKREYFLSYKNMLNVVEYRGIKVEKQHHKTQEEFFKEYDDCESVEEIKERLSYLVFGKEDNKILLCWFKERKLGPSIRIVVEHMQNEKVKKALVVVDEGVTPGSKEILKNLKICEKIIIDVWTLQESMIFVPDHIYVPEHRICSVREKKNLFKTYGLTKKNLPYITSDDIMVKYLGASKGQLILILRVSDTNPELKIKSYRIVV